MIKNPNKESKVVVLQGFEKINMLKHKITRISKREMAKKKKFLVALVQNNPLTKLSSDYGI